MKNNRGNIRKKKEKYLVLPGSIALTLGKCQSLFFSAFNLIAKVSKSPGF
jgi:hypothetical protein